LTSSKWGGLLTRLLILLFLINASPLLADLKASQQVIIDLANTPDNQELAATMLALADNSQIKSLNAALASNEWVHPNKDLLSAPRKHTSLWLKASLHNSSNQARTRWLVLEPWRLSRVDAFFFNPASSNLIWHTASGLAIPLKDRRVKNGKTIIPVHLNAGETQELLIKIHSDSLPFISIKSWEPVAYTESLTSKRTFLAALFAGILMLLVVLLLQFNLSLFITGSWLLIAFIFETEKDGFFSNYLLSFLENYSANIRISGWLFTEQLFLVTSVVLLGLQKKKNWRRFLVLTALLAFFVSGLSFWLDGVSVRNLGILVTGFYAISWLVMLIPAFQIKKPGQLIILLLLFIYWFTSTFLLLGYTFNFYYTSAFTAARIYIEIAIALALIITYSWQHKHQLKVTEDALKKHESEYRKMLENEVKARTEDLNSALETARKNNMAKVNFLGQVTHDLRSPLTAILGYAQLQATKAVSSHKANQIIQDSATYMKDLVDGLVNYAKDITQDSEQRDIYLIAFIDNLVNQVHMLANKQGNRFQLKIETELPTVIRCNSTQLQRILLNLLDNAAKYTQQGYISLTISVNNSSTGKPQLAFCVTDTGQGMTIEQLQKIYQPFYQTSKNNPGFGLGLSICIELVESMGGTFNLKSEPGKGTVASFTIPYTPGDEQLVNPSLPAVQDLLPDFNAQGKAVWIVEDSLKIGELLESELTDMGFTTQLTSSAEAFIEAMAKTDERPAAIITDYRLPKASGAQVLSAVRSDWPGVPVILLSATQNNNPQPFKASEPRFDAYLSKPVDLLELRLKLAELCNLEPKD